MANSLQIDAHKAVRSCVINMLSQPISADDLKAVLCYLSRHLRSLIVGGQDDLKSLIPQPLESPTPSPLSTVSTLLEQVNNMITRLDQGALVQNEDIVNIREQVKGISR